MLWYKAWFETRFRLVFLLVWFLALAVFASFAPRNPNPQPLAALLAVFSLFFFFVPVMLAGDGIKTQPSFTVTKGVHGSMYFTLSLPVSRLRLLAVRAGFGFLETILFIGALCLGAWARIPLLRAQVAPDDALKYFVAVVFCVSGIYSLGVLLAVFLDHQWQIWSCLFVVMALRVFSPHIPASVNILRALAEDSPIFTHTMPWLSMSISFGAALVLIVAALKMVQAREY